MNDDDLRALVRTAMADLKRDVLARIERPENVIVHAAREGQRLMHRRAQRAESRLHSAEADIRLLRRRIAWLEEHEGRLLELLRQAEVRVDLSPRLMAAEKELQLLRVALTEERRWNNWKRIASGSPADPETT